MLSSSQLKIAVLLVPPVQLLDMAPVDLFHMLSKQYLTECRLPQPLIDLGLEQVEICYVAEDGPVGRSSSSETKESGGDHVEVKLAALTASARVLVTHGLGDSNVQPGCVNILFVPGPDPSVVPSERVRNFVRRHAEVEDTVIMSVCTGVYVLGHSGVLDNKSVTGPRALVGMELKKKFPRALWVERRWEMDISGRLWTSGGITNGQDMVAAYLRRHFAKELSDLVCAFADVGERAQDYDSTGVEEGMWFVWLIARSWVRGILGNGTRNQKNKMRVE